MNRRIIPFIIEYLRLFSLNLLTVIKLNNINPISIIKWGVYKLEVNIQISFGMLLNVVIVPPNIIYKYATHVVIGVVNNVSSVQDFLYFSFKNSFWKK